MTLRALHSGLGLNVPDASTAPGTPIMRANPASYVVQPSLRRPGKPGVDLRL